ncbi:MAG: hypothetical protein A2452_08520 [Candidatus Firestonebacteria bacterium RIFOXYC2_FULL_39_67]|nr:MAG: hypothetical protein A2536_05505 [Candidatus Firestonebacteria bacterium RIFOXYD2_FULL_39_29]OGF56957.1 MAG: hypothetical protein A2452_08520 [Candidatus Firestonebacteria bacterium RIFOXYC2_FULL_39_67]
MNGMIFIIVLLASLVSSAEDQSLSIVRNPLLDANTRTVFMRPILGQDETVWYFKSSEDESDFALIAEGKNGAEIKIQSLGRLIDQTKSIIPYFKSLKRLFLDSEGRIWIIVLIKNETVDFDYFAIIYDPKIGRIQTGPYEDILALAIDKNNGKMHFVGNGKTIEPFVNTDGTVFYICPDKPVMKNISIIFYEKTAIKEFKASRLRYYQKGKWCTYSCEISGWNGFQAPFFIDNNVLCVNATKSYESYNIYSSDWIAYDSEGLHPKYKEWKTYVYTGSTWKLSDRNIDPEINSKERNDVLECCELVNDNNIIGALRLNNSEMIYLSKGSVPGKDGLYLIRENILYRIDLDVSFMDISEFGGRLKAFKSNGKIWVSKYRKVSIEEEKQHYFVLLDSVIKEKDLIRVKWSKLK